MSDITAEQHVRNMATADGDDGECFTSGDIVGSANYLSEHFIKRIAELEAEVERLRDVNASLNSRLNRIASADTHVTVEELRESALAEDCIACNWHLREDPHRDHCDKHKAEGGA
jgi:hypothetical protein